MRPTPQDRPAAPLPPAGAVRSACIAALTFALAGGPSPAAEPVRGLDAHVRRAVADWGVPGAAIAVVRDDRVILAKGYGVRRLGDPAPVDERTIFGIASCTKAFTAAAVAMLVDEGKVRWDDPVRRHLPAFRLADPYVSQEVTVRDLLSHRSGLPAWGGDLMWWGSTYTRDEVLRRVGSVEPASSFRSRYAYQNTMFLAAGQVVAAVAGRSWDDFILDRIFLPLGMASSRTTLAGIDGVANRASPHLEGGAALRPIPWRSLDNAGPAGSINSNAVDMAAWVRFLLARGRRDGRRLLSEAAFREMWGAQTVIPIAGEAERTPSPPRFLAYGLGWNLRDYRGRKLVRHGGWTDGMRSIVALVPEENIGVVVLTNLHDRDLSPALALDILDRLLGTRGEDWSAAYLAAAREEKAKAAEKRREREEARARDTRPSLPLAAYAGAYDNDVYGGAAVEARDGRLVLRLTSSPTFVADLDHWHFDTFEATWRDPIAGRGPVTFALDAGGRIAEMRLKVDDYVEPSEYTFRRVAEGAR